MILTQTYNYGIHLPVRWIISQTPHGVAGNMEYWSRHIRPTLITWKPSTSLSGETALQIFRSSMCSEREIRAAAWSHCCILALPDSSLSGLSSNPFPLHDFSPWLTSWSAQKEHTPRKAKCQHQRQYPLVQLLPSVASLYQDLNSNSRSNWYSE